MDAISWREPPCRSACWRWSRHDDWTLTRLLSGLPAGQWDELVAEALDCLWRHDFAHDEAAFISRGVRAAARCLDRTRVAECLRWHGVSVTSLEDDHLADREGRAR